MPQIVYANVKGEPLLAPVMLPARRRRLDRVVREYAADLHAPFLVSVHGRGGVLAPTNETIRVRPKSIPKGLKPDARKEWENRLWRNTTVRKDEIVLITILPQGGRGGGAGKIALTIASIALMAFAGPLAGALAGAINVTNKFAIAAIQAGITIGGAALLMAFSRKNQDNSPIYGVSGGGTLPKPNDRIPVGYGRFWTQPDLTQPDYYRYQDQEDTVLFKRMSIGLGKYKLRKIRVGSTTFWSGSLLDPNGGVVTSGIADAFPNCKFELIYGQASTLVPSSVITSGSVSGQTIPLSTEPDPILGPFAVNPVGTVVNKLQVDFSTPSGYSRNNHETTQDLWFEYAPIDEDDEPTGSWQTLYRTTAAIYTTKHLRWSKMLDVPEGRYAVRARNNRAEIDGGDNCNYSWDGLRGYVPDEAVRTGRTELAIQVVSGENLDITSFSDIYVEVERWGPVWDDAEEEFQEGLIQKCVDCFVDVLTDDDYGAAFPVSLVDMEKVVAYRTAVTEYDTFDGLIRGPITVRDVLAQIMSNMRAEPIRLGAGYSFIRDEPSTLRRHVFSRSQIIRDSVVIEEVPKADEGEGHVVIEFNPDADPKRKQTVQAYYGTQSRTPRRMQWPGIKTGDHARHLARWFAAAAYYRRTRIEFDAELAGRIPLRGQSALVDPWFVESRKVASVLSRSSNTLTVDRDVAVVSGDRLVLRDTTGREWGPVQVTQGANLRLLVLNSTDVTAEEAATGINLGDVIATDTSGILTSVVVGPLADLGTTWLIESMTPGENGKTSLTAKIDAAEVYTAIDAAMPPDSPLTWDLVPVESPNITAFSASIDQHTSSLVVQWSIVAQVGAVRYEVEVAYADNADAWEQVYVGARQTGEAPIRYLSTGEPVYVRARAFGGTGLPGEWSTPESIVAPQPVVSAETPWTSLDDATQAGLLAVNTRLQEARALVEQLSAQVQGLEQQVDDNLKFERKRLESVRGSARAELEDVRVVLADETTALTVRMDTAESAIDDNTASIETLETTKVDAAGATAAAQTLLNATFGAGSANVKMRLAALATPSGYDALFQIEASVTGADGSYKATGLLIAVLTVASVQVSRIEFKADQFLFRLGDGTTGAVLDEDGLLLADRFDVASAGSGERTRYTKFGMYVYDSGGTLRVAVGNLTPP